MIVKELIDILSKLKQDQLILVNGYETGYDEIYQDNIDEITINVYPYAASYDGKYRDSLMDQPCEHIAYVIGR